MKVLITGANGLVGKHIMRQLLLEGHQVFALARSPEKILEVPSSRVFRWTHTEIPPVESLRGIDAVVNLAGENIAGGRWTSRRKDLILSSRKIGTQNLVEGISKLPPAERPRLFLSTSAIGYFGDTGQDAVDESSPVGEGFLAKVCTEWEEAANLSEKLGLRLVIMRLGIVLAKEGGALPKMGPVVLGNGRQWMSWVHIQDIVNFTLLALNDENIRGTYNLVSPHPVTNKDFIKTLGQALKYPLTLPAPGLALKCVLGEMSEMLLGSQKVFPKRLLNSGFQFKYENLESALKELYQSDCYLDVYYFENQFVPVNRHQVFPFFSKAENLEELTPPWLQFRIVRKSSQNIETNTTIDYALKIRGIPVRWKTLIKEWNPEQSFVDDQLSGPYKKWHHLHLFEEVPGGTLLRDEVTFQIPGGPLGRFLLYPLIRREVEAIFAYRRKKIAELLPEKNSLQNRENHINSGATP